MKNEEVVVCATGNAKCKLFLEQSEAPEPHE